MKSIPDSPYTGIFAQLDDTALKHCSIRHYQPKSIIVSANSLSDFNLFLVLKGVCLISSTTFSTTSNSTFWCSAPYRVTPGEFFGICEIISPTVIKRQASITAKTPVTLLAIEGQEFLRWQTEYPKLYNTVIFQILNKHYSIRNMLTYYTSSSSNHAGAQYLYYLYLTYKQGCHEDSYLGPVRIWETQKEISTAIAKNVRSVERMLSTFKEQGMINISRGKLYINAAQAKLLSSYGI